MSGNCLADATHKDFLYISFSACGHDDNARLLLFDQSQNLFFGMTQDDMQIHIRLSCLQQSTFHAFKPAAIFSVKLIELVHEIRLDPGFVMNMDQACLLKTSGNKF
jgi:hypothetical protein